MKTRDIIQIAVVNEKNPERFQDEVNKVLVAHERVTGIEHYNDTGSLIAIIKYTQTIEEIETADDYFEALGKHYVCNDCPFCELDPDRRSVTHYCHHNKDRIRLKSSACEWFLKGLRDGDFHLVTPEERKAQYDRMNKEEMKRRKERIKLTQRQAYYDRKKRRISEEKKKALPEPKKED